MDRNLSEAWLACSNPPLGIEPDRVGAWLAASDERLTPPFRFDLIAGGRSNLTFRVADAACNELVLRRPPLGNTLASAHDMGREYRILSALQHSSVPVPRPIAICEDPAICDKSLYAMERVEGWVLRGPDVTERAFPETRERLKISDSLISVLANLHLVDPGAVGLADLGRHAGYIERQLRRWNRQWRAAKTREMPAIEEAHRRLAASVPRQQRVSIVHGDYRLDNVVCSPDATVAAVLDWELCTLGDPLADLGGLLVSWVREGDESGGALGTTPTAAGGFPSREEIVTAYAERSELDVSAVDYYVAFAYWKLACIGEGVYARYRAGVMGDSAVSLADLAQRVERLVELSLNHNA